MQRSTWSIIGSWGIIQWQIQWKNVAWTHHCCSSKRPVFRPEEAAFPQATCSPIARIKCQGYASCSCIMAQVLEDRTATREMMKTNPSRGISLLGAERSLQHEHLVWNSNFASRVMRLCSVEPWNPAMSIVQGRARYTEYCSDGTQ